MLTKRIIPCLDVRNGRVVKGRKFEGIKEVDDPVALGKKYNDEGADELVFYDITASNEDRSIFTDVVKEVASVISIPFTVGGGISTVEDFTRVLRAGADKVSINSQAVKNPDLITQAAEKFGSQCVMVSIDAKKNGDSWKVYIKGGREDTGLDAIEWAKKAEELGAGEICINSIDEDGVKEGYDLELNKKLHEELTIPIIASGGAGSLEDFKEVLEIGADAALAASVFHYDEIKIPELKEYLKDSGLEIRL